MPGGPLNLNSTNQPRPWSPRESSPSGKIRNKILESNRSNLFKDFLFFGPMPPHVLVDFVVLPPGHGSSVTDF